MVSLRSRIRRHPVLATLALVGVLGAVAIGWALVEARLLLIDHAVVVDPDLPPEFEGARIVFVADIHAGTLLGEGRVKRVVETVNELRPALIVLGGDNIGGGESGGEMFYPQAEKLQADHGVLGVLGNHEGRWGTDISASDLTSAGVVVLANANVRVRRGAASIRVGGVEDLLVGSPDFERAARDVAQDEFAVIVSHNPDALPEGLKQTRGAFDLALSGHTHGGQITAFGLWAPIMPTRYGQRFRGGWSEVEGVPTLVTRGAGTFILPMRFFAPPQLHVIELRRADTARVLP